jgi:thioredoxin-like negative regulator of GroEL
LAFVEGYQAGLARGQSANKPMLVFFTAEWCTFCRQMAEEAFCDGQVTKLADQFVCVLVDADREEQVCRQFNVRGYPTVVFLSPRGTPLNRATGKQSAAQLVIEMHSALQAVARRIDSGPAVRRR